MVLKFGKNVSHLKFVTTYFLCFFLIGKPVLNCKAGWQLYLSSCYLFSSTALNWQNSRDFCVGKEALLLILGQDTREWVSDLWTNIHIHTPIAEKCNLLNLVCFLQNFIGNRISKLQSHWIGLTDQTGQWRWTDGSPYIMDSRFGKTLTQKSLHLAHSRCVIHAKSCNFVGVWNQHLACYFTQKGC